MDDQEIRFEEHLTIHRKVTLKKARSEPPRRVVCRRLRVLWSWISLVWNFFIGGS